MQNSRYPLILTAAFTLAQLAIIALFGYTPYPDSEGYILLAQQCVEQGEPYPIASQLYSYPFLWNIGSINAVALSLKLFHSVTPLLLLYALLKGATAWLCYDIALLLTRSRRIAFVALSIYILYPANYGEATSTLGEIPFIFLALLAVRLSLSSKLRIAAGMVLAVAGWIRPFALLFLVALALFCAFTAHNKRHWWKPVLHLVSGYAVAVLLIGTLTYTRTGLFLYQAKTGWMALVDYSYEHSSVGCDSVAASYPAAIRDDSTKNVSEKDAAWRTMFLQWLAHHPGEYLGQMPRKLIDTYASDNVNFCTFLPDKAEREYMYEELSLPTIISQFPHLTAVQWLTLFNLLFFYLLLLTALLSLWWFRPESHLLPVAIVVLGTLMLLFVGHGEARFHQPFMPFIILLSALFFDRWTSNKVHS